MLSRRVAERKESIVRKKVIKRITCDDSFPYVTYIVAIVPIYYQDVSVFLELFHI